MPVATFDMLNGRVTTRLVEAGAATKHAEIVAESLIYAEASGLLSHGLVRLPFLLDQTRTGKIDGTAVPELRTAGPGLLLCDARRGYGYVAANHTVSRMSAPLHSGAGFVFASISNSHHFGVAGQWAERLAEQGFVGLAISSTFGAIAPLGGHSAVLGNPPLALGLPITHGDPMVVDLAPAIAARGLIVAAAERGETIPPEWALDADGNPTTDPTKALSGTVQAVGGHKGVVLAMLLDSLLLATTEVAVPSQVPSVFTASGPPPRLGHLLIGIDPVALGITDASVKVGRYLSEILSDGSQMRLPGARRAAARRQTITEGLEISDRQAEMLDLCLADRRKAGQNRSEI